MTLERNSARFGAPESRDLQREERESQRPTVPVAVDATALFRAAAERNAIARLRERRLSRASDLPTIPVNYGFGFEVSA